MRRKRVTIKQILLLIFLISVPLALFQNVIADVAADWNWNEFLHCWQSAFAYLGFVDHPEGYAPQTLEGAMGLLSVTITGVCGAFALVFGGVHYWCKFGDYS